MDREKGHANKTFSDVIRQRVIDEVRGRDPDELRASLEAAGGSALAGIHVIPAERVIKRSGHPRMTFGEFVASRSLEFGVHTMDIAHALGRPQRVEPGAAAIITDILDGLLGSSLPKSLESDTTTYILTGTGRRSLTPDDRFKLGELADRFPLLR